MPLVRWDPFRNMATLQDRINRLFDDAFPRSGEGGEGLAISDWHPLVDIYEVEEGVVIQMDLPGVDKAEVSVEVKENTLIIKGGREPDTSVSDESYYRQERPFGKFQRSFAMHTTVVPDSIKATFKNGILKIELPNPKEVMPEQVSVNID